MNKASVEEASRNFVEYDYPDQDTRIMGEVLVDILFALSMSSGGALAGWILHRKLRLKAAGAGEEPRIAHEVLERLQELARSMAANVGEHSTRVEEINQELSSADGNEPDAVVSVVAKLVEANQQMQHQLSSVEDKLNEQARKVAASAAEARTDALTGLPNRRAFDDELVQCLTQFGREHKAFSLLIGDIDHFKRFNDTHGHQVGDEVLRGVARVLRTQARPTDVVTRYGGEEFAILLPKTCVDDAIECLEAVRRGVETARFRSPSAELRVTMSFGAAEAAAGEDAGELIRRADTALYASKASGRNCGFWHDGRGIRPILAAAPSASKHVGEARQAMPSQPAPQASAPVATSSSVAATHQEASRTACAPNDFRASLTRRLAEWRRGGPTPGVLLVHVDRFAEIVARNGAEAGKLLIRSTSQYLYAAVREMDLAGQFAEATFAMLLPGSSLTATVDVAERLRDAISRCTLPIRGVPLQFTVSVAGTTAIQGDDARTMLARLEQCLQSAAKSGGNCTFFHDGRQPAPARPALQQAAASGPVVK